MKLRIRKWDQFQHYSKRRPPWIKLHRQLLDNRHWHELSPSSCKLLVECWLLASEESGGVLSGDVVTDLAWRLHRTANELVPALQELTDAGFIDVDYNNEEGDASEVLAERYSRVEKRREKKSKRAVRKYSAAFREVWKIHARGPKAKADDAYKKAVSNGVTHDVIVAKLTGYVAAELRLDDNPPFKGQHLFRWLNEGRWEEEFEAKKDERYRPASVFEWFPPALKELGGGK